jgi:hypothetical protein
VGGLRRSELVALDVRDLHPREHGLAATIRRGKTDQEGHGRTIALPYPADPHLCPVIALRRWLDTAEIERGAVFRRMRRGTTSPPAVSAPSRSP